MFVIVETADVEVLGVHVVEDRTTAHALFTRIRDANEVQEWEASELNHECDGTLRLAGDDAYAVQMIERPLYGSEA